MLARRIVFIAALIILSCASVAPEDTFAQAEPSEATTTPSEKSAAEEETEEKSKHLTPEQIRDMAKAYARERTDSIEYFKPTYNNISKLYWGLGIFDADHDYEAVDHYLMINECEIFNNYFNDDFEWKKIHSATVDFLKNNYKEFPKRFEFIRPVELGRYDFSKEAFYVMDLDLNEGARIYQMRQGLVNDKVCGKLGSLEDYPRDLHIVLSRPFRLNYLPVSPFDAQDFIARTTHANYEKHMNASTTKQRSAYNRTAYLKIRVRIVKHLGYETMTTGWFATKVYAVLEGYDVFEDKEEKRLLFSTRG